MAVLTSSCGIGEGTRGIPDAGSRTFGRLAVVLSVPRDGAVTVEAAARLLRYRGVDRDGAQILAGARDYDVDPMGACTLVDEEAILDDALATSPPDAAVQMLDAGELFVRVAGQALKVPPRYVPEMVPFVSGVVYESGDIALDPDAELGIRAEATISAYGGHEVGRFLAPAELPSMPHLLTIGRASPDSGTATIDSGSDLEVTWDGAARSRGTVTLVFARDTGPSLRCRVADTGRFVVPASRLARIVDHSQGEGITLALERLRSTPFSAPGIDAAEIDVTVRDVVALHAE